MISIRNCGVFSGRNTCQKIPVRPRRSGIVGVWVLVHHVFLGPAVSVVGFLELGTRRRVQSTMTPLTQLALGALRELRSCSRRHAWVNVTAGWKLGVAPWVKGRSVVVLIVP